MGIDFLDIAFRVEKEFGIRLRDSFVYDVTDRWKRHPAPRGYEGDLTVGELFEIVELQIAAQRGTVPEDAWPRFRQIISAALAVPLDNVERDALLARDLGIS